MNGNDLIELLKQNVSGVLSTVDVVVGALFTAIFLRHKTETEEFEKIKNGKLGEVAEDLLEKGGMTYTEFYKAKNFLSVAKMADEYYSKNKYENNKQEYDFDWFIRLYEAAGNVSNENLQRLWARILAGEIAENGTFSLKTIDVLRNIGVKDAELFNRICEHSFQGDKNSVFLAWNTEFNERHGIYYSDIMRLDELGLLFKDSNIGSRIILDKTKKLFCRNENLAMIVAFANDNEQEILIQHYSFTQAGGEIAAIIGKTASDEEFIEYAKLLSRKYEFGDFEVHRIVQINEDSVQIDDEDLLKMGINED